MSSNVFGSFYDRAIVQDKSFELSDRAYNLTIGLLLAYGFFVNWLLSAYFAPMVANLFYRGSGLLFVLAYFGLTFAGSALLRFENFAIGLFGYTLILLPVGVTVSAILAQYDIALIDEAFLYTGIIVLCMLLAATFRPEWFEHMGSALAVALGITLVFGIFTIFIRGLGTIYDYAIILIMALYVGYDWARANSVQKTRSNALIAAASLYLDIMNILLRVLRILARSKGGRRRD